ncbi:DUF305 domain-containing protein [Sphaerisporangium sp. TRM90804]|uniref:DUF305 domain-containing protein n=1 Tax=Sphaerisporangium sp. TRM90804 TaxID=3031113 RepID=UPI00244A3B26|nr:DUF305 domain-containing protein [Sphaerisporangium sp. TRM90804]MDH2427185.1 DUF305 domain-containing protein [Sphaerisporangium sp. TRM90804]
MRRAAPLRQAAAAWPLTAALLAAAPLGAACSAAPPRAAGTAAPAATSSATPAPSAAPSSQHPLAVAVSRGFGPTDLAWIELMIPMDESILRMLAVVPEKTGDSGLRRLAERLGEDHRAEVVKLRQLLLRAAAPENNPHQGHNMPGMVTDEEQKEMEAAKGAAFDRLFTGHLREHLKQSVIVADGERDAGIHKDTKALATAVAKARAAQLAELGRLGG